MHTSVVSRGHKISYRAEGTGPPLVLLAGWSQWTDRWWDAGYVDRLRDEYRIIGIDRLGHGESDKPHDSGEYSEPSIVADIVAVLDAEQVDRALVWGFSMGARNAASLAELEPLRVVGLVCGAGVPLPRSPESFAQVRAMAERISTDEGMIAFLQGAGAVPETIALSMERNNSAALAAAMAGGADWSPRPDGIAAPSLWYTGSEDSLASLTAEALDAASRLGVETHEMPGADHGGSFQRTNEVLAFVKPFLDRHR